MTEKKYLYTGAYTQKPTPVVLHGRTNDNRCIIELPSGGVYAVNPLYLQEVKPYTVGVKFVGNDKLYHYEANEGDFHVGDLVFSDTHQALIAICALDTEKTNAPSRLTGKVYTPGRTVL